MFMPSGVAAAAGGGYRFTMTAANSGVNDGYIDTVVGSINPDQDMFTGRPGIIWNLSNLITNASNMVVSTDDGGVVDDDTFWRSLSITGTFIGGASTIILLRSARSSFITGSWTFAPKADSFIVANIYDCVISR